jgi:hypothetical protein
VADPRLGCGPHRIFGLKTTSDLLAAFIRWAQAHQNDTKLRSEAPVIGRMRSLSATAPGSLPKVTWRRRIEIDPRVRGFKLHFNEVDFR